MFSAPSIKVKLGRGVVNLSSLGHGSALHQTRTDATCHQRSTRFFNGVDIGVAVHKHSMTLYTT